MRIFTFMRPLWS